MKQDLALPKNRKEERGNCKSLRIVVSYFTGQEYPKMPLQTYANSGLLKERNKLPLVTEVV